MSKKLDVARVWVDMEDALVPYFRLDPCERALYYHLLRHTRLIGRRRMRISKRMLAYSACVCVTTVMNRLRSLVRKGCVKTHERNYSGELIEVLLPSEVPGCVRPEGGRMRVTENQNEGNCIKNPKLRQAIWRRERGQCFYCLRRLWPKIATLDHVVPLAEGGDHSIRNVVACCFDCNRRKGMTPAWAYLKTLRRERRLAAREYKLRIAALRALREGKAKPMARRNQHV
jgi:hypothetical protein